MTTTKTATIWTHKVIDNTGHSWVFPSEGAAMQFAARVGDPRTPGTVCTVRYRPAVGAPLVTIARFGRER